MTGTSAISSSAMPEAVVASELAATRPRSATHPPAARSRTVVRARERLERHAAIWRDRPLTRALYAQYHRMIDAERSHATGPDLEVGGGHGSFAEFRPETISCDVVPCPWLDCAADAAHLPFAGNSLANIIMIDVLHHVAASARFFDEAVRTLAPGGRIILVEPYVSPVSWIAWRFFHDEEIDLTARPLEDGECSAEPRAGDRSGMASACPRGLKPAAREDSDIALDAPAGASADPWTANIAIPTLLFYSHLDRFRSRYPMLTVVRRKRFDLFVMPLSGGFEKRRLIPHPLVPLGRAVERLLTPLAPLFAFRCFIVIEKATNAKPEH